MFTPLTLCYVAFAPQSSITVPVIDLCDYTESFEDFLKSFKSTTSSEATDALSHLNIEDEDVELTDTPRRRSTRNARGSRRQQAVPEPKLKYMEQLQEVANRERSSVTIELEDLKQVCSRCILYTYVKIKIKIKKQQKNN